MTKTFRPSKKRPDPVRETFDLVVLRDEREEAHTFRTRAVIDANSVSSALASARDPEKAMAAMMRMMAKMLDNSDGTPHGWTPELIVLEADDQDAPQEDAREQAQIDAIPNAYRLEPNVSATVTTLADPVEDPDEDDRVVNMFRGPDGEAYTYAEVQKFLPFDQGSSRRRWRYLIEEDDEVSVDAEQLRDVFEWLVSLAARRPTVRSS